MLITITPVNSSVFGYSGQIYRQIIGLICLFLCFLPFHSSSASNYNTGAVYFAKGDYTSALSIWKPLAQQGNAAAQYSMGLLYDQGKGVEQDTGKALQFFQQAVAQNLPAAQYYLGIKYFAGLGIDKNINKARTLLTQAAEQEHLLAQYNLGVLYSQENSDSQDLQAAVLWLTRAAESGHAPAALGQTCLPTDCIDPHRMSGLTAPHHADDDPFGPSFL